MEHYDDDDDDVSFAKWMSSFWGHSWIKEDERRFRNHHGSQDASYRKTSLPCSFPGLPRNTSSGSHPRRHSLEGQGFRCRTHMRDYRKCLEDGWNQKEDPVPKFGHFQSPLNSNCVLEPNTLSLWEIPDHVLQPIHSLYFILQHFLNRSSFFMTLASEEYSWLFFRMMLSLGSSDISTSLDSE